MHTCHNIVFRFLLVERVRYHGGLKRARVVAVNSCAGEGVRHQRQQRRGHQELVQVARSCEVAAHGSSCSR